MSTLVTIQSTDLITNSRADINNNFSALNTDKIETSVLDTDTTLAANSDLKLASQKAVKAYVDAGGNVNASTTVRGIVELATSAEINAGTATGGTGASLVVTAEALKASQVPITRLYVNSGSPYTWSKPAGLKYVVVEVVGSGGAGGGTATNSHGAPGGGAGGYSKKTIATGTLGATETVTVPAGGAGVLNGTGNSGGTTSFGTHCTATGGTGGTADGTGTAGTGGVGASGDINVNGGGGVAGNTASQGSGAGGASVLGGGGESKNGANTAGANGGNYGGGGSGSKTNSGGAAQVGGAGAQGVCILTEYYS